MAYEKQTFIDREVDADGNVLVEGTTLTKAIMDHIEDGISNVAYDDLKNKPFGDIAYSDSCSFETTPEVSFDFAGQLTFYKISDLQLTYDQLLKTVFTVASGETTTEVTPTAENFLFNNEAICGFMAADGDLAIGVAYATGDATTDYGVVSPPETGTYLGWPAGDVPSATLSISIYCEDLKKLDEKYLPEILPEVTADDNGKMLQVVDGVWTAVAITNGNEVAY